MAIPDTVAAFGGLNVDHLYRDCPLLKGLMSHESQGFNQYLGAELRGEVDPLGTDICGWCQRVWMARNCPGDDTDGGT